MKVSLRKIGRSQGVPIPKSMLVLVGLEGTADLQVRDGVIEIRAVRRNPREGWADDARRLAVEAQRILGASLPDDHWQMAAARSGQVKSGEYRMG